MITNEKIIRPAFVFLHMAINGTTYSQSEALIKAAIQRGIEKDEEDYAKATDQKDN